MSSLNNSKGEGRHKNPAWGFYEEVTENSSNENILSQNCKCKRCGQLVHAKALKLKRHLQKCENSKLTAERHLSDDAAGSLPPSKFTYLILNKQL